LYKEVKYQWREDISKLSCNFSDKEAVHYAHTEGSLCEKRKEERSSRQRDYSKKKEREKETKERNFHIAPKLKRRDLKFE